MASTAPLGTTIYFKRRTRPRRAGTLKNGLTGPERATLLRLRAHLRRPEAASIGERQQAAIDALIALRRAFGRDEGYEERADLAVLRRYSDLLAARLRSQRGGVIARPARTPSAAALAALAG